MSRRKFKEITEAVRIRKLVHGGQGLAELSDGRKVFVWNALPGELVQARVFRQKPSYAEAIAEEVLEPSPERVEPKDANYLATSPWQIMDYAAENRAKREIVLELFGRDKIVLPEVGETVHDDRQWRYRAKMEYSFWGDDDGLHLALHRRGSHGKEIVEGSSLAMPAVDAAAAAVCTALSRLEMRAGDLKTVIVRCDQQGRTVASLFVKATEFPQLDVPHQLHGLRVYYSHPQSPASVATKLLYELGDCTLHDVLLDQEFTYDVDSFFQVNLPIFEQALGAIKAACDSVSLTDMYAGVGSIGLSVARERVNLIDLDGPSVAMARLNAAASQLDATVIEASTEKALQYISGSEPVIFDPPRAGLHARVVERVLETKPAQVIYLSCNPATQARDLALLQAGYTVTDFTVYNFFPRTPHIESLAILAAN
jgi:23S rRNA (uracil1939-C5)-methyltransferase